MDELYRAYLNFLESLRQGLAALTELAEAKTAAVERDDLVALDEVLRQEQAQALNFRGLDLNRAKLLKEMNLQDVPMTQVPRRFPPAMQAEACQAVAALQSQYRLYQERSGKARETLEKNLQEVENIIGGMGAGPMVTGPGYGGLDAQLPKSLKTDFRA